MKPIRVEVRLKNNKLLARREAAGLSGTELAARAGVPAQTIYAFECMSASPLRGRGDWKETAIRLANYWETTPEELFPNVVQRVERTRGSFAVDEQQIGALMAGASTRDSLPLLPEEVPERAAFNAEVRAMAEEWFKSICDRYTGNVRKVAMWKARYGWDTGVELTFSEVAEQYNITTERVRQIILKLERMMRHSTGLSGQLRGACDP